jgi:hypothetical protein
MRNAIFTEHERKILKHFLDKNERLDGFATLKHRMCNSKSIIASDFLLYIRMGSHLHPVLKTFIPELEKLNDLELPDLRFTR